MHDPSRVPGWTTCLVLQVGYGIVGHGVVHLSCDASVLSRILVDEQLLALFPLAVDPFGDFRSPIEQVTRSWVVLAEKVVRSLAQLMQLLRLLSQ